MKKPQNHCSSLYMISLVIITWANLDTQRKISQNIFNTAQEPSVGLKDSVLLLVAQVLLNKVLSSDKRSKQNPQRKATKVLQLKESGLAHNWEYSRSLLVGTTKQHAYRAFESPSDRQSYSQDALQRKTRYRNLQALSLTMKKKGTIKNKRKLNL